MNSDILGSRDVIVYKQGRKSHFSDLVVSEVPITIMLNDSELATLVCSPYAYEELAYGFLLSEGLIQKPNEVQEIALREEQGVLWVETVKHVPAVDNFLRRNFASCCGKGRPSLYFVNDRDQLEPVESNARFKAEHLLHLMVEMDRNSETFQRTGGVHTAALADKNGIIVSYEDIGRHNALDRILGYAFTRGINPYDKLILLSGRIASEMLIKAVRMRVPVIVSRSASTGLAIDLAEELGVTIVGFTRGDQLTVYSHSNRVLFE